MGHLNWPARVYVSVVYLLGALTGAAVLARTAWSPPMLLYILILAALLYWLATIRFQLPSGVWYAPTFPVSITAMLAFGPGVAAVAQALAIAVISSRPLWKRLFDIGSAVLGTALAWAAFRTLGGRAGAAEVQVLPGLVAGTVQLAAALLLGTVGGALAHQAPVLPMLRYASPVQMAVWPVAATLLAPAFGGASVWVGFGSLTAVGVLVYISGRDEGRTRTSADRDALTGLFNHQFLHRRLADLIRESSRSRAPLAVVMLDIFGFKAYNDRFGHAAGDGVLARLGAAIRGRVGWPNLGARYGGDELVLVLVGPRAAAAETLCRGLAEHVAGQPHAAELELLWGIARAPEDGWHKNELLATAAERLYRAQHAEQMREEDRLRRAEQLSALGELAAGIAHELRNPLAAVRGLVQLSSERLDPGMYQIVLAELDRMADLTAEFLTMARPGPLPVEAVDLAELVEAAARLGEALAQQYGGRLEVRAQTGLPPVAGHPERLRQVMLNLLRNAFEAAPRGTVVLEAGSTDAEVWLAVTDTGPGVPPEMAERIFDPFFSTKVAGNGLGLAVSHQIIHELGGRLELNPNPGGGARFVVRLPRQGGAPCSG